MGELCHVGGCWFLVLTEAFRGPDIAEVTHKLYHYPLLAECQLFCLFCYEFQEEPLSQGINIFPS